MLLAFVRDVEREEVDGVPLVKEFPNVFLEESPSQPLDREIEFGIDVRPGTQPISILPYWMAPTELKEVECDCYDG